MVVPDGFNEHPLHKGYFANSEGVVWSARSKRTLNGFLNHGKPTLQVFDGSGKKLTLPMRVFVDECLRGSTTAPEGFIAHPLHNTYFAHADGRIWSGRMKKLMSGSTRESIDVIHITLDKGLRTLYNRAVFVDECLRGAIIPEGFRQHPVYEGYYANDQGRIWSSKSKTYLEGYLPRGGYPVIGVYMGNRMRPIGVHIIVFECFHGSKVDSSTHQIDHINGTKTDARLCNLQMLTKVEHARKTAASGKASAGPAMSKPTIRYKLNDAGEEIESREYPSAKAAAEDMNVSWGVITVAVRRGKMSLGFYWRYADQPDLDGEEWKSLKEFGFGRTQVSNKGRVCTYFGIKTFGTKKADGYYIVGIKGRSRLIHRLVALAFLGEPPSEAHTIVDHIDSDPANNHHTNLRWATHKENASYAQAKAVVAHNADGEYRRWNSIVDAACDLKVHATDISKALSGRKKSHAGFTWKRLDSE